MTGSQKCPRSILGYFKLVPSLFKIKNWGMENKKCVFGSDSGSARFIKKELNSRHNKRMFKKLNLQT